ncbi:MAG: hypothetical protein ACR2J7_02310 [Luteimonas sp.]
MGLFDDSRANTLRGLDAAELGKRIERARKARDRARDLLQRQKLASRARTGSKRGASGQANQRTKQKAELLAEILVRFEDQLKGVEKAGAAVKSKVKASARPAATRAAAKQGAVTKKTATPKRAGGKRGATPPGRKPTARAADAGQSPATAKKARQTSPASKAASSSTKPRAKVGAGRGAEPAAKPITPRRALANTRKLLEAKQARERQGQPWQTLDPVHDHLPQPGYQSGQAAEKAEELHSGQSRMTPIEGSISTRDRKNQGKRDRRGDSQ